MKVDLSDYFPPVDQAQNDPIYTKSIEMNSSLSTDFSGLWIRPSVGKNSAEPFDLLDTT